MSTSILSAPLSAEHFSAFGNVLEHNRSQRQQPCADVYDGDGQAAKPSLDLIRVDEPSAYPVSLDRLERHPHSAQTFIALEDARFLVVVCPSLDDGSPDLANLRAFETAPGQIVTFGRNIWHKGITALTPHAVFAMTMLKCDGSGDTEFSSLAQPVVIDRGSESTAPVRCDRRSGA